MSSQITEVMPQAPGSNEDRLSLKQPAWQVMVLTVLTFGLYFIYWCYKNWRDLSAQMGRCDLESHQNQGLAGTKEPKMGAQESALSSSGTSPVHETDHDRDAEPLAHNPDSNVLENVVKNKSERAESPGLIESLLPAHLSNFKNASPMIRSIFTMVPIVTHYMFYTLTLGIARIQPKKYSTVASHPVLCSLAIVFAWITLSCLSTLHGPLYLAFFLNVIPLAIVQHWLNRYWDSVEDAGLITRHGFTFKELLTVIVGALYFGFIVSGFLINPGK